MYVLVLSLLLAYQASVDASTLTCSNTCPIMHPQQLYCNADMVVRVKIQDASFVNAQHEVTDHTRSTDIRYESKILTVYKGADPSKEGTVLYFYSPSYTCTVPVLTKDEDYIVVGKVIDGLLVVTSCDGMAANWTALTPYQRSGFKDRYADQCGFCTIAGAATTKYTGSAASLAGEESGYWSVKDCLFNPFPSAHYGGEDCETLYSYCSPRLSDGECEWEATVGYEDCFQRREDAWFFQTKGQAAYTCRSQCDALNTKLQRWKCVKATKKLEKQGYAPC